MVRVHLNCELCCKSLILNVLSVLLVVVVTALVTTPLAG